MTASAAARRTRRARGKQVVVEPSPPEIVSAALSPNDLRNVLERSRGTREMDDNNVAAAGPSRVVNNRQQNGWMANQLERLERELAEARRTTRIPDREEVARRNYQCPEGSTNRTHQRRRESNPFGHRAYRSRSPERRRFSPIHVRSGSAHARRTYESSDSNRSSSGSWDSDYEPTVSSHRRRRTREPRNQGRRRESLAGEWTSSPFSRAIDKVEPPRGFQNPPVSKYKGVTDPIEHVRHFEQAMTLYRGRELLMCKVFPISFEGATLTWFSTLPARSINCWNDFVRVFTRRFIACSKPPRTMTDLLAMRKRAGEGIREYSGRFIEMVHEVRGCPERLAVEAFKNGLSKSTEIFRELARRPVSSVEELTDKVNEHARLEDELSEIPKPHRADIHSKEKERPRSTHVPKPINQGWVNRSVNVIFTTPLERIMEDIQEEDYFQWPRFMTSDPSTRTNPHLRCRYHRTNGHSTESCRNLKSYLEELAAAGYLKEYIQPQGRTLARGRPEPELALINVIHGLPKEPLFSLEEVRLQIETMGLSSKVYTVEPVLGNKRTRPMKNSQNVISFSDGDLEGISLPHEDSLLVTLQIGPGHRVRRLLIDPASGADIMYYHCFRSLKLRKSDLTPAVTGYVGFIGEQGRAMGMIELPVSSQGTTVLVNFAVMDFPAPYNAILGKSFLHKMGAIASTLHQKFKWVTPEGVKEVRGDQKVARQCLVAAVESLSMQPGREGKPIRIPRKTEGVTIPQREIEVPIGAVEEKSTL